VFPANTERQQTSSRMRFGAGYVLKLLCLLSGHKPTLERTLTNDKSGFFFPLLHETQELLAQCRQAEEFVWEKVQI